MESFGMQSTQNIRSHPSIISKILAPKSKHSIGSYLLNIDVYNEIISLNVKILYSSTCLRRSPICSFSPFSTAVSLYRFNPGTTQF
jgi:hypothetical protein